MYEMRLLVKMKIEVRLTTHTAISGMRRSFEMMHSIIVANFTSVSSKEKDEEILFFGISN